MIEINRWVVKPDEASVFEVPGTASGALVVRAGRVALILKNYPEATVHHVLTKVEGICVEEDIEGNFTRFNTRTSSAEERKIALAYFGSRAHMYLPAPKGTEVTIGKREGLVVRDHAQALVYPPLIADYPLAQLIEQDRDLAPQHVTILAGESPYVTIRNTAERLSQFVRVSETK